jgi:DNA-binding NtrC family response regulator
MPQPSVLLFHPDPVEARVLTGMLRTAGYQVHATDTVTDATAILTCQPLDVVIVDGSLGGQDHTRFLCDARVAYPDLPRLLIAESERSETALQALRTGRVQGIIRRPPRSVELLVAVELALTDPEALRDRDPHLVREPAEAEKTLDTAERLIWTESNTG